MYYTTTSSSQEAQERNTSSLVPGYYLLTVMKAEDKESKRGVPMTVLTLLHGETQDKMNYYLLYSENMSWKIDRFLAAIGVEFAKGFNVDINDQLCRGRQLVALIGWEPGKSEGVKFPKVIDVFNAHSPSCPPLGALAADQYELHRLTREGYDPYSAPRSTSSPQSGYQSPYQGGGRQGGYSATPHQGYQGSYQGGYQSARPTQAAPQQGGLGLQTPNKPASMFEEDDDIPF